MYSKVKILGHPIHPMLIAFPVAFYSATLVAFAVYAANGNQFWLNLAIAGAIAGAGMAVIAALPGFIDFLFGIPRRSNAKVVAMAHGGVNVVALVLFIITAVSYVDNWNGPATSATLGLALSAAGVALTLVAGALGWTLVQTYHIGVKLTPAQQGDELAVHESERQLTIVRHRKAS